jgi:FAD-dependent urate hydroxylase
MLRSKLSNQNSVTIIGAGPNGLSAAAFLRAAGADVQIFGVPLEAWKEKMPKGMILRSTKISSSIASPGDSLSIPQYEKQTGMCIDRHPTVGQFVAYGEWFLNKAVADVDPTMIKTVRQDQDGFMLELEDGRVVRTRSVVLATGITPFPYIPEEFASIPKHLASHSSDYKTFDQFENKKVAIIGKGQSALESAALLHESGADVEIITRGAYLSFLSRYNRQGLWGKITSIPGVNQFLYPPTDLAGPPNNWAIADPVIYRSLSREERAKLFELIGPVGSGALEPRLVGIPVTTQVQVKAGHEEENKVCLFLSDGTSREVDHVILATGFRPNINQLQMLSNELKAAIQQENNSPILSLGYESVSVRGLYVLGALACLSQGPINRFVCGTYPVGQYLTEAVTGSRIGYPEKRIRRYVKGRRLLYRMLQPANGISK